MKITFLGTGTSTGIPYIGCNCYVCMSDDLKDKRLRCSALFQIGDNNILIDCGPDFRQQALLNRINKIDALLLTHEHFDHMGGIDDLRPFGDVSIYANDETLNAVKRVFSYCFDNDYPGIPKLSLKRIDNKPFDVLGICILPIKASHYKLSIFGYRFNNVAYLTDYT